MKKTIFLLSAMAMIACAIIYSCSKEPQTGTSENEPSTGVNLSKGGSKAPGGVGWAPEGTQKKATENGYQEIPPAGWSYAGYSIMRKAYVMDYLDFNKTVSCTCNNASGRCKPFEASGPGGSISGCGGDCTDCTMKQSMMYKNQNVDLESGGYYNPSLKTRVLKSGESAPAVFDALFEVPEFKKELSRFLKEAYGEQPVQKPVKGIDGTLSAPKGFAIVGISVMGRAMAVIVPQAFARLYLTYFNSKASCSCDKGSCALKDKTIFGTGAIWCDGDCNTCTLTTDSRMSPASNYDIKIQSFRY